MRKLASVLLVSAVAVAGCSSSSQRSSSAAASSTEARVLPVSAVAVPTVTGPVAGGSPDIPMNAMPPELETQYGYTESEYFFAGSASAYTPTGTWGDDGRWSVAPASTASYKSRMIVRIPTDPNRFNGSVVVEWLNETPGRDTDFGFGFAHSELLRDGFGYVGVSAQALGVNGPSGLTAQNPGRYGTLVHPGDDYSYDVFSQAAQALWRPNGPNPLGSLHPRHVIATGTSQSAALLVTYVNAIASAANVYDGLLIQSRGSYGTAINSTSSPSMPTTAHIRADVGRPVMTIESETDLFGYGFYPARQPDTDFVRTWELAGTAHQDQRIFDYVTASAAVWSAGGQSPYDPHLCGRINEGPESYIINAAFAALNTWVSDGSRPPVGPPFEINDGGTAIARDARGNALGGVRTPAVDAPISTLDGTPQPTKTLPCSWAGTTTPFDPATLQALYPTHDAYVAKVKDAAAAAVTKGFLLAADEPTIIAQAQTAPIPG